MKTHILMMGLLFMTTIAYSQTKPTISFSSDYAMEDANSSFTICYTLDADFAQGEFSDYFIKYKEKIDEKFISFDSIQIANTAGEHCFTITTIASFDYSENLVFENELHFDVPNYSSSSSVIIGSNPAISLVHDEDGFSDEGEIDDPKYLIKGFDNETDKPGYSVSLYLNQDLVTNDTFGLTNANFLDSIGWVAKNSTFEQLSIAYKGIEPIASQSILCIKKFIFTSTFDNTDSTKIEIHVDGVVSTDFTVNNYTTSSFLTDQQWTNLYVYEGIFKETPVLLLHGTLSDGITFGIPREDYQYDIPFDWEDMQLFFFDRPASQYAFINCDQINESCSLILFFKDQGNWVSENGILADELALFSVCTVFCETIDCTGDSLSVYNVCSNNAVDILFLVDESGSISEQEFVNIQEAILDASTKIDCELLDSRFSAYGFSGENTFHEIVKFTDGPIDISSHNQSGGGTDVTDAFDELVSSIDLDEINVREDTKFIIYLLTDTHSGGINGYSPMNTIKDVNFGAEVEVVFYLPNSSNNVSDETAVSAIASKGGSYVGPVANNPQDPQGEGPPRKMYSYTNMLTNIDVSIQDLINCDTLEFSYSGDFQNIESMDIMTSDGAVVLESLSDFIFITNGEGTYSMNIVTTNGCEYSLSYYYENSNCIIKAKSEQSSKNPRVAKPENYLAETEDLEDDFKIIVYPVPTSDLLSIYIDNSLEINRIQVYSNTGQLVEEVAHRTTKSKTTQIDTKNYNSGIYSAKMIDVKTGKFFFKKFIIIQ